MDNNNNKKSPFFFIFTSIKKESNPLYFWRENNSVAAGQSLVGGEICQTSKSWVPEKKEKEIAATPPTDEEEQDEQNKKISLSIFRFCVYFNESKKKKKKNETSAVTLTSFSARIKYLTSNTSSSFPLRFLVSAENPQLSKKKIEKRNKKMADDDFLFSLRRWRAAAVIFSILTLFVLVRTRMDVEKRI